MKTRVLIMGNTLLVILTIGVNSLANILPINGKYTGELSDAIPNLFVPSGITFAVWGAIYALLIVFALYQLLSIKKKSDIDTGFVSKIGVFFVLGNIGNIIWIFLWHYEYVVYSLFAMILLLVSLLIIYLRLQIGRSESSVKERIFVRLPISIYLGWITVATIANVTAVLVVSNLDGLFLGEEIWTMFVISVATVITVLILHTRNDIGYAAVIMWALLGIAIKRLENDPIYGIQSGIATVAILSIIIILVFTVAKNVIIGEPIKL